MASGGTGAAETPFSASFPADNFADGLCTGGPAKSRGPRGRSSTSLPVQLACALPRLALPDALGSPWSASCPLSPFLFSWAEGRV